MPDEEKIIKNIRELLSEFGIDRDAGAMWSELKALSPKPKPQHPKESAAVARLQRQLQAKGVDIPLQTLRQALGNRAETRKQQRNLLEKKARAAIRKKGTSR